MNFNNFEQEKLYNLLKKVALENFDSVFDAAFWVKEKMRELCGVEDL